jgi:hypothetical protein
VQVHLPESSPLLVYIKPHKMICIHYVCISRGTYISVLHRQSKNLEATTNDDQQWRNKRIREQQPAESTLRKQGDNHKATRVPAPQSNRTQQQSPAHNLNQGRPTEAKPTTAPACLVQVHIHKADSIYLKKLQGCFSD